MVQVAWDVDNLRVLTRNGIICETCCAQYTTGDHCCFLNPNAPLWSNLTTYAKGEEVKQSGWVNYIFRSKMDGNINHPPGTSPTWWLKSTEEACDNAYWDNYPPYYGVGRTPMYLKLTAYGIKLCKCRSPWGLWNEYASEENSMINRAYILPFDSLNSHWKCTTSNGIVVQVDIPGSYWIAISIVTPYMYRFEQDCMQGQGLYFGGHAFIYSSTDYVAKDKCLFDGTIYPNMMGKADPQGDCNYSGNERGDSMFGHVKLEIFKGWDDWYDNTDYIAGHSVKCDGVLYTCIIDHLSDASNRPGTGENWQNYWIVLEGDCL